MTNAAGMVPREDGKAESLERSNIVLIGMPGAGKSTVGVVLAKRLGLAFVDVDLLLQSRHGRRLQDLIDGAGLAFFRTLEEETLTSLELAGTVIATGGSAIYSEAGMTSLAASGRIVFLDAPLAALLHRIQDMDQRGLVIDPGESFADLYARRRPLYQRWAELTIAVDSGGIEAIATRIVNTLKSAGPAQD